jgi:photosystem II stability/assembly factor-like uncharacterized protein
MKTLLSLAVVLCVLALPPEPARAQWVQTGGPEGGEISSIVSNASMVLAATYNGVFRSSDSGMTWALVNTGLTKLNIACVAVNGPNLYGATAGTTFVSTDNGTGWKEGGPGLPFSYYVRFLAFVGTDVFAGVDVGGVYRSTDYGSSWAAANAGLADTNVSALAAFGSTLFVGTQGGLYRSTDNGMKWTPSNAGLAAN